MEQAQHVATSRLTQRAQAFGNIKDSLNRRNRFDSFTLNLKGRSSISALLSGLSRKANVQLELRNSSGELVSVARKQGKSKRVLDLADMSEGTYYLRAVLKRGQATRYRLNVSTADIIPAIPPDYAGQTPGTARIVSLSSTPALFSDYVGPEDTQDYYSFTVGEAGSPSAKFNLAVQGSGTVTPSIVTLRDSLNGIVRRIYPGQGENTINRTLAAGTYYLQVEPGYQGAQYSLSMAATSIPDTAGNTSAQAYDLGPLTTPRSITEFVGAGDKTDYFAINLAEPKTLQLQIKGRDGNLLAGGINVYLRNNALNVVKHVYAIDGGGVEINNQGLASGTYYLQVEPFSNSNDSEYTLTLGTTS